MRYDVPDAMHDELRNWAAWCWLGQWPHPLPKTRCGSAEGDYRAPPEWGTEEVPDPPRIYPNAKRARVVQEVWERMHDEPRLVLKAEYPARQSSGRVEGGRDLASRRLGITLRVYEESLAYAVRRVSEAFK